MTSFYSEEELSQLGLKSIGKDVKISRNAKFYSPSKTVIGDNVRIDDFCIISGSVKIGSHIHIGAYVALYGGMGIELEDYTGISCRSTIYSAMDDFGGDCLVGPIHDENLTNVTGGKVVLRKFSQVGAHSLVFPSVEIGDGCVIGACSMVKQNTEAWKIYAGIPAIKIKDRSMKMAELITGGQIL